MQVAGRARAADLCREEGSEAPRDRNPCNAVSLQDRQLSNPQELSRGQ
jgi:hypothetical protein